jgi:hypothetical protein
MERHDLPVFFDDPFWVGVLEIHDEHGLPRPGTSSARADRMWRSV